MGNNRHGNEIRGRVRSTADLVITLHWDATHKKWRIRGDTGRVGQTVADTAASTVALDKATVRELVSAVRDRLEALLW